MALSEDQQRHVLARVKSIVVDDFHTDFEEIYSYAVTVLELAPEQANNEVRNALNHLARAIIAEDQAVADENLSQAKGHIERAKRDCVKLAVIQLHEQARSDILSIETIEGSVPLSVKTRLRTIESHGKDARLAEAGGDGDALDKWSNVLAEYKQFLEDLGHQFTIPTGRMATARRWGLIARRQVLGFVVGLIVAMAGHWLYDRLLVPPIVSVPGSKPAAHTPAANNPSIGAKPVTPEPKKK